MLVGPSVEGARPWLVVPGRADGGCAVMLLGPPDGAALVPMPGRAPGAGVLILPAIPSEGALGRPPKPPGRAEGAGWENPPLGGAMTGGGAGTGAGAGIGRDRPKPPQGRLP